MFDDRMSRLARLPQRPDETWQGAFARLPGWVTGETERPVRPYVPLWIAVKADLIAHGDVCRPDDRSHARLVDALLDFAADRSIGGYRPGRIEVRDPSLAEHLRGLLAPAGIHVACRKELLAHDGVMRVMEERMYDGPPSPGPLSRRGVTVEAMRAFADAARSFHEAAPWRLLSDEDLIHVEAPRPPRGFAWAVVLGAAGQTFGLGFFARREDLWEMRRGDDPETWLAQGGKRQWNLGFGPITELPLADADLWQEHDLPVAAPEAYPLLAGYDAEGTIERATPAVLASVEGLLRALAASPEDAIDRGRWTTAVETARGPVECTLALPDLLDPPSPKTLLKRGFEFDRRLFDQMHRQMIRVLEENPPADIDEMNARLAAPAALDPDPAMPPRDALEEAQDLCHQAYDARGRRRMQLARKALEICADCADAHVLLAEAESDRERAAERYRQAVAAAERVLGPERFEEDAGHFWGFTETRPYMRARMGLAQCLEGQDLIDEAAGHYRELLRLNPGDNQGVRYLLLVLLLRLGRDAEAARLLKRYDDDPGASWAFARALLAYRLGGDVPPARAELRKAIKTNRFVVEQLLDEPAPWIPDSYVPGSREEAIICAAEIRPAVEVCAGATAWLERWGSGGRRPAGRIERRPGKRRRRKSR